MMKRFVLLLALLLPLPALAQNAPNWGLDYIPGVDEWRQWWSSKQDRNGDASAQRVMPLGGSFLLDLRTYLGRLPQPVEAYGAKCDGVTDDAPALNAAATALSAQGGGTLYVGGRCLVDSADLVVPEGVRVTGNRHVGFQRQFLGYDTVRTALIVNPSRTIRLGSNTQLRDLAILRKGLVTPTDMRSAMTQIAQFAGTAVTIGGNPALYSTDAAASNLMIVGFDRCVDIGYVNRAHLRSIFGDCNNGARVNHSHDNSRITEAHFWETLTTNQVWSFPSWAVASTSNQNGHVRVVLSAPMAADKTLVTGDWVNALLPGSMAPNRVTVTVVDSTTLDLDGTTYLGAYTGGGQIAVNLNRRPGNDVEVYNSENTQITNSFSYGYVGGTHVGTRAGWTNFVGKSYDAAYDLRDPNGVAFRIDSEGAVCDPVYVAAAACGSYGTSVVGGVLVSAASEIIVNSPQSQEGHSFTGVAIQSAGGYTIQVLAGAATFTGNTSTGMGSIYVADAAQAVRFIGNDWPGGFIGAQSGVANARITMVGNRLAPGQTVVQLLTSGGQIGLAVADDGGVAVGSLNLGGCPIISGTGSPNGVLIAPACAVFLNKAGGPGTTMYVKETLTGNTGWVAK